MSSILKALRKLEEEKAAMGEGGVDLARDILKRSAGKRETTNQQGLKIIFFSVLTVAVVATTIYLLLLTKPEAQSLSGEEGGQNLTPVVASSRLEQKATVPPQLVTVKPPVAVENHPLAEPEPNSEPETSISPQSELQKVQDSQAEVEPEQPQTVQVQPFPELETEPADDQVETVAVQPAHSSAVPVLPTELSALQVDMISFKPEPADRLAVINDLPVMEGTMVEDVLVMEILEKSVQVVWQDRTYDLPLTDSTAQ